MYAKRQGKTWVVRGRRRALGRHRSRRAALEQEGAVHLHLRQHGKEYKRKGKGKAKRKARRGKR